MKKFALLICLLSMAVFAMPQMAFADTAPTVTITFDKDTVAVGETVTARYKIENAENYQYGWYFWTLETEDGKSQCPDEGYGDLSGLEGELSFVPKFGSMLKLQITLNYVNGDSDVFFSERIPVTGDQSKPPEMQIDIDKESVNVGEAATVTYHVSG